MVGCPTGSQWEVNWWPLDFLWLLLPSSLWMLLLLGSPGSSSFPWGGAGQHGVAQCGLGEPVAWCSGQAHSQGDLGVGGCSPTHMVQCWGGGLGGRGAAACPPACCSHREPPTCLHCAAVGGQLPHHILPGELAAREVTAEAPVLPLAAKSLESPGLKGW